MYNSVAASESGTDYAVIQTNHDTRISSYPCRAVTDPRDGRRVALKKLPNVFQSLVSSKRVFRELKMLCYFKHENVSILSSPRDSVQSICKNQNCFESIIIQYSITVLVLILSSTTSQVLAYVIQ